MPTDDSIILRKNRELEQVSRSEYQMDKVQLEFFPFNDIEPVKKPLDVISIYTATGSGGMVTTGSDGLRQGVEIRTNKHLFKSNQPKLWAGNFEHATKVTTLGQFRSWTEYTNTTLFNDNVVEFSASYYIKNQETYPYPIYFNNGPQQGEEAAIEPLTKPFRLDSSVIEGAYPIHRPKGNIEDGNPDFNLPQGNSRIFQFMPYEEYIPAEEINPFLDLGERHIGAGSMENMIVIEGYVDITTTSILPFNDIADELIVDQLALENTVQNADYISLLKKLDINLDEDLRQVYTQKSAPAGYNVYGPEQARYGTDSIAYVGWLRGS